MERRLTLDERAASLTLSNAPSLFPEEDADVGPQSVLKLKRSGGAPRIEVFADAQYFYTDNMFLTDRNKQSADLLVSTIQGALTVAKFGILEGEFVQRVGYRHQWFDYGLTDRRTIDAYDFDTATFKSVRLNAFDFNAQTFFADGTWKRDNWVAGLSFDYQRLLTTSSYEEFYHEFTPRWTIKRVVPLCPKSALSLGYEGDYRSTETHNPPDAFTSNLNDRTDHSLFADVNYAFCKYAIGQAYYRFQYTYFAGSERRQDYLNTFGLALYCPFTENAGLRFFAAYDILRTNGKFVNNYDKLDSGVGVNLMVRF